MKDIVSTDMRSKSSIIKERKRIKRCDFCGETILAMAKKCKHCSEILDTTLRAAEEAKKYNNSPNVFMNAAVSNTSTTVIESKTVTTTEKNRSVSFILGLGIIFMPYIFAWFRFTLREGHTIESRIISFSWLIIVMSAGMSGGR